MGTIADLLGDALNSALTSADDGNTEQAPSGAAALLQELKRDEDVAQREHARSVMLTAISEHTGRPEEELGGSATFEDLDLDPLGVYAIVTPVERELGRGFNDQDIARWTTIGEMLSAAEGIVSDESGVKES